MWTIFKNKLAHFNGGLMQILEEIDFSLTLEEIDFSLTLDFWH